MSKNWFEVDKKGLQALQAGKSKTFIIRELVQNAFDENIRKCEVFINWNSSDVSIRVVDDNPEGFQYLSHAYTLYADTYKRKDVKKRGRFNLGEKEVLSICDYAEISTTKGTIVFDNEGRKHLKSKFKNGSQVYLNVKMLKTEYNELIEYAKSILVPEGVEYFVNDELVDFKTWFRTTEGKLKTEILDENGIFKPTRRNTRIHIHKDVEKPILYEMGIPVCDIDCDYSLDVQQKIPLSTDRTKVQVSYLKELYALVLNDTYDEVTEDTSSNNWIRTAVTSDNIESEAVRKVVKERYGDKVVVASPGDPNSVDEAITRGYRVIRGSEMSAEEWKNVRRNNVIESSSSAFGATPTDDWEQVKPDKNMLRVEDFIDRVANRLLGIQVKIRYIKSNSVSHRASYGGKTITFNLTRLPSDFFKLEKDMVSSSLLGLIMHELAHERGMHYEHAYHECLTHMGSRLTFIMRDEPNFFKV